MKAAIEYLDDCYKPIFGPAKGGPDNIDNTRNTLACSHQYSESHPKNGIFGDEISQGG